MFSYFWLYQTDLPPGIEVITFSTTHLGRVLKALSLIVLTAIYYQRQTRLIRKRIERVIAVLLMASYLFRWIWGEGFRPNHQ
jgi:hypothetical protein